MSPLQRGLPGLAYDTVASSSWCCFCPLPSFIFLHRVYHCVSLIDQNASWGSGSGGALLMSAAGTPRSYSRSRKREREKRRGIGRKGQALERKAGLVMPLCQQCQSCPYLNQLPRVVPSVRTVLLTQLPKKINHNVYEMN